MDKPCSPTGQAFTPTQTHKPGNKTPCCAWCKGKPPTQTLSTGWAEPLPASSSSPRHRQNAAGPPSCGAVRARPDDRLPVVDWQSFGTSGRAMKRILAVLVMAGLTVAFAEAAIISISITDNLQSLPPSGPPLDVGGSASVTLPVIGSACPIVGSQLQPFVAHLERARQGKPRHRVQRMDRVPHRSPQKGRSQESELQIPPMALESINSITAIRAATLLPHPSPSTSHRVAVKDPPSPISLTLWIAVPRR
jgi:hypothetical protein